MGGHGTFHPKGALQVSGPFHKYNGEVKHGGAWRHFESCNVTADDQPEYQSSLGRDPRLDPSPPVAGCDHVITTTHVTYMSDGEEWAAQRGHGSNMSRGTLRVNNPLTIANVEMEMLNGVYHEHRGNSSKTVSKCICQSTIVL